jgi:hypothetical protein
MLYETALGSTTAMCGDMTSAAAYRAHVPLTLVCLCVLHTLVIPYAVQVLSGFHKRGIACLAFSASGALLATVGLDDDHSVAVYSVAGVTRHHFSTSTT